MTIDPQRVAELTQEYGGQSASDIIDAVNLLASINEEKRREVFSFFCRYCGSDDPDCQCWNDE